MNRVAFDVRELYFATQYMPVCRVLRRRGVDCGFVAYHNRPTALEMKKKALVEADVDVTWVDTRAEGLQRYRELRPDWIVFGNGYGHLSEFPEETQTAMLYHGIGMKSDVYAPHLAELDAPDRLAAERARATEEQIDKTDGMVSARIADYLFHSSIPANRDSGLEALASAPARLET